MRRERERDQDIEETLSLCAALKSYLYRRDARAPVDTTPPFFLLSSSSSWLLVLPPGAPPRQSKRTSNNNKKQQEEEEFIYIFIVVITKRMNCCEKALSCYISLIICSEECRILNYASISSRNSLAEQLHLYKVFMRIRWSHWTF